MTEKQILKADLKKLLKTRKETAREFKKALAEAERKIIRSKRRAESADKEIVRAILAAERRLNVLAGRGTK